MNISSNINRFFKVTFFTVLFSFQGLFPCFSDLPEDGQAPSDYVLALRQKVESVLRARDKSCKVMHQETTKDRRSAFFGESALVWVGAKIAGVAGAKAVSVVVGVVIEAGSLVAGPILIISIGVNALLDMDKDDPIKGSGGGGGNGTDKDKDKKSGGSDPKEPKKTNQEKIDEIMSYKKQEDLSPIRHYESHSSKHHQNSPEGVGKSPVDGPAVLDRALSSPQCKQLVAIENKKIVVFKEHSPGRFHGYIEENFHNLDDELQRLLVEEGLVRSIKSGKVL